MPFLALLPVALLAWLKDRQQIGLPLVAVSASYAVGYTLLVSKWPMWWGGHCYGPRLLTEITPFVLILLIPAIQVIKNSVPIRTFFVATMILAIGIQMVGAFCYPHGGWDGSPQGVDEHPERVWNWRDSEIVRTAAGGPALEGYDGWR
jgi:hypothetical protein